MEYVVLDIETTGLDPEHSSIIEIAAILVSGKKILKEFHSFVKYEEKLPELIRRKLTGMKEEYLVDAPTIEKVLEDLRLFIEKHPVVSHNGFKFDFPMLERVGLKIPEKYDSMEFAFFVLPTHELGHSSTALASRYGLGETPHRALEDCRLEFEVICHLQEEWKEREKTKAKALKALAERMGWWWTHMLSGPSEPIDHLSTLAEKHEPYRKKNPSQEQLELGTEGIDIEEMNHYFLPEGNPDSEYAEDRPEQREMAKMVAESFGNKTHLVIEAGTGTGKSKAYLVPSVLFALKNNRPVIVATHTKALQDQLFFKEILHLKKLVNPDLRVAVLKGKKNYVCLKKFEDFLEEVLTELQQRSLYEFGKDGTSFTTRLAGILLASWVLETNRGDWDELPYWFKEKIPKRVEREVCNWDELCIKEVCEFHEEEKCFLAKARLRARDADLVIANHAIVLSGIVPVKENEQVIVDEEVKADSSTPYAHAIFPNEAKFLVIDEAHHLEDDATSAWTRSISQAEFDLLLEQLYGKRGIKNLIDSVATAKNSQRLFEQARRFADMESNTKLAIKVFFTEMLPQLVSESSYEGASNYCSFEELDASPENKKVLLSALEDLETRIRDWADVIEVFANEADVETTKKILSVRARNARKLADTMGLLISNDSAYVRYLERVKNFIEVKAAPISVATHLRDMVYNNFSSVILASATLTLNKNFNFFSSTCGTNLIPEEKVNYRLLKSSFDYEKQVKFFVVKGFVYESSEAGKKKHYDGCCNFLEKAIPASNGGSLVLCSSHSQVDQLYSHLENPLAKNNLLLLRQHKGTSVNSVVRDFTEDVNSVLIGTETLWQGIDVPGETLRTLFIYKIPYRMPNIPLLKARTEAIRKRGGNGFAEYYEPLAALTLKQGFGRLIRKATDKGIVVMLDGKLLLKPMLIDSFPEGVKIIGAEESVIIDALKAQTESLNK